VLEIPAQFHNVSPNCLVPLAPKETVLLVEKQRAVAGTKLNLSLIAEQSSGVDAAEQIVGVEAVPACGCEGSNDRTFPAVLSIDSDEKRIRLIANGSHVVEAKHEAASIEIVSSRGEISSF